MPIEAATSVFECSMDRLMRMVAASEEFQTMVGAVATEGVTVEAAALNHVFYPDVLHGLDASTDPPRAIVDDVEGSYVSRLLGLDTRAYDRSLNVVLELVVPDDDISDVSIWLRTHAQRRYAMKRFGTIIEEMLALSGTGVSVAGETHLFLSGITIEAGPAMLSPEEIEQESDETLDGHYFVVLNVELGN